MPTSASDRIAVIGSGPAGIACAKALVRRGAKVVLFDGGRDLDQGRQALVARLAGSTPDQWAADDVASFTCNDTAGGNGLPKKLVFGSDYIYRSDDSAFPVAGNVAAATTLARGGFSMAWGGAMLPAHEDDIKDWPIGSAELAPGYRRVLADMPYSGTGDELAADFPLLGQPQGRLRLPRQAEDLLADLRGWAGKQDGEDRLSFGQSRLAVRTADDAQGSGCRYCGYCLAGCPYGSIHTVGGDLRAMIGAGWVDYRPGVLVRRFSEVGKTVRLWTVNEKDPAVGTEEQNFSRVFLAAGAINTTHITLESLGQFGKPVRFQDSQKFAIPLLRLRRTPLEWPHVNSLASLFIEARFPTVSPHWIHMQISAVNDMVLERLKVPGRKGLRWRLLAPGVERLMIAWCSLHSTLSDGFAATLTQGRDGAPGTLHMIRVASPDAASITRSFLLRLMRHGLGFQSLFLPMSMKSPLAGTSHFGGSFPMRRNPRAFNDTDVLGRPTGLSRVHLIDGSVLPTIPATTIMLQIMANADRIATDVELV